MMLADRPYLGVSARFDLGGLVTGLYDEASVLVGRMSGPLLGVPGTRPMQMRDAVGSPVLDVDLAPNRFGGHHVGRFLTVTGPDGSALGTVYVRELGRAVVYGLHDDATDTDVGWLSSQDPAWHAFALTDAVGRRVGWQQVVVSNLHAFAASVQSWHVWMTQPLDPRLAPLALAATTFPPALLKNTLSH